MSVSVLAWVVAAWLPVAAAGAAETAFVITGADLEVHRSASDLRVVPVPGFTQIGYPHRGEVGLVYNPVLVPGATVDEAVARTPALPHLIRLKMGQTTILIDPDANYRGAMPGHLDRNHSIIRAQRTWEALRDRGAHVVRRALRVGERADTLSAQDIKPRAILLRPNVLDKPVPGNDNRYRIPTIPRPKTDLDHRLMAAAR